MQRIGVMEEIVGKNVDENLKTFYYENSNSDFETTEIEFLSLSHSISGSVKRTRKWVVWKDGPFLQIREDTEGIFPMIERTVLYDRRDAVEFMKRYLPSFHLIDAWNTKGGKHARMVILPKEMVGRVKFDEYEKRWGGPKYVFPQNFAKVFEDLLYIEVRGVNMGECEGRVREIYEKEGLFHGYEEIKNVIENEIVERVKKEFEGFEKVTENEKYFIDEFLLGDKKFYYVYRVLLKVKDFDEVEKLKEKLRKIEEVSVKMVGDEMKNDERNKKDENNENNERKEGGDNMERGKKTEFEKELLESFFLCKRKMEFPLNYEEVLKEVEDAEICVLNFENEDDPEKEYAVMFEIEKLEKKKMDGVDIFEVTGWGYVKNKEVDGLKVEEKSSCFRVRFRISCDVVVESIENLYAGCYFSVGKRIGIFLDFLGRWGREIVEKVENTGEKKKTIFAEIVGGKEE